MNRDVNGTRRPSRSTTPSNLAIGALLVLVVVEGLLWLGAESQLRDAREQAIASVNAAAAPGRVEAQARARLRLAAQQRMLAVADGELSLEQARFELLSGASGHAWRATPAVARSRCADAMAQRDAAYRRVGKQRDYDFFRYWDEYVSSACSAPDAG